MQQKAFSFWRALPPEPQTRALPLDPAVGTAPDPIIFLQYFCVCCLKYAISLPKPRVST